MSRTEHLQTFWSSFGLMWDDWNSHLGCGHKKGECSNGSHEAGEGEGGQVRGHLWIGEKADGFMTYKSVSRDKGHMYNF